MAQAQRTLYHPHRPLMLMGKYNKETDLEKPWYSFFPEPHEWCYYTEKMQNEPYYFFYGPDDDRIKDRAESWVRKNDERYNRLYLECSMPRDDRTYTNTIYKIHHTKAGSITILRRIWLDRDGYAQPEGPPVDVEHGQWMGKHAPKPLCVNDMTCDKTSVLREPWYKFFPIDNKKDGSDDTWCKDNPNKVKRRDGNQYYEFFQTKDLARDAYSGKHEWTDAAGNQYSLLLECSLPENMDYQGTRAEEENGYYKVNHESREDIIVKRLIWIQEGK